MKCIVNHSQFISKKSLSNHRRWCTGKMSPLSYIGINKGNKNVNWKGDGVGKKSGLHFWVNKNINKLKICKECGTYKNIDLANITGIYSRDFNNWEYLCRKHHMLSDGRLESLLLLRRNLCSV